MTDANVPAKEPDSKSDWTSIDIFLFSNGQHYSPPRKYHLMTNQLDWWNNTLTYLAKSQFGSVHSMIDLYTIEGTKVETPLQLKHNTAYVAVIPPEYFINASYEKYLIKATRSWEKSQAKRSSNTAISNQEESQNLEGKSNSDNKESESTYVKAIRDGSVTLKTIVASMVDNQLSEIVKPHADTSDKTINNKSYMSPVKQSDKLKRLSTQRPALVKNINAMSSSPKSRKPPIKMKDCVKINTNSSCGRPFLNSNNKILSRDKIFKPLQKIQKLPELAQTKVEELVTCSATKLINKTSMPKPLGIDNVIEKDSSVVSHIYNNPQSEKPSIAFPPNARLSIVTNVNRQGGTHELFDVSYPAILPNNTIGTSECSITAITASNLESKTCNPTPRTKDVIIPPGTSILTKPENNVEYINKEGTVNLKLNIEIWNAPNESKYYNSAAKRESLCILHTEKGSQVELEDKILDQHKTLQKTIEGELNGDEGNNKIIILKCSCPNQCCNDDTIKSEIEQNNKNSMFRVHNTNSKILIFLPVLKLDENCKRCSCYKEHKETNISNQNHAIDDTVKKTDKTASCISLYKARMEKIASHAEIFSRNNSIEINVETRDKNESTLVKRKSVAIREDLILPEVENVKQPSKGILDETSKVLTNVQEPPKVFMKGQELSKVSVKVQEPSKVSLKPHEAIKVLVKPQEPAPALCTEKHDSLAFECVSTGRMHASSNKSTQTEYCDVLVEARLQSDGHYSFYLPPLNIVKNYRL